MAPTIHFVRHAQGWHNVNVENEIMHDPELTPTGEQQCADLRASFPHHDKLKALIASPMTRTLNTAILSFGRDDLYPIKAIDTLQELSDLPSDTGSTPAQLREKFGTKADVSQVREEWTQKMDGELFEPTLDKIVERAKASRRAIREIVSKLGDDDHVAVVSHGGFLHWLTDEWQDIPMPYRKWSLETMTCVFVLTTMVIATNWKNCEYRSYQFVDLEGKDDDAHVAETKQSWRRRRGSEVMLTAEEQAELRRTLQREIVPSLKVKV